MIKYYSQRQQSNCQMKSSNSSIRLEQIRKKYDTPTRRENKENYGRSSPIQKDAGDKPFGNILENKFESNNNLNIKSSLSKRILEDQTIKAKMTSSIFGDKNEMHKNNNYESNRSQIRGSYGFHDQNKSNRTQEEQAVFKRIKEMKQSLMTKTTYGCIRPTSSAVEFQKEEPQKKPENSTQKKQNIDQINSKIQQILNSIRQNQTRTKAYQCLLSDQKETLAQKAEISSKKNFTSNYEQLKNKYAGTPNAEAHIKQSASIYQEENKRAINSPLQEKINGFKLNTEQKRDSSRARSFINSVQRETKEAGNSYHLNSGRKLDDQITKIQDKIKFFEEEKRKLNIDFKPYNFTHSKSSSNLSVKSFSVHKFDRIEDDRKLSEYRNRYSKIKTPPNIKDKNKADYTPIKEYKMNPSKTYEKTKVEKYSSIKNEQKESFELKLVPVCVSKRNQNEETHRKMKEENEEESIKKSWMIEKGGNQISYEDYEDLKKRAQEGIMGRKAKLGNYKSRIKKSDETKRLIQFLGEQAKLDEEFRNNKISFDSDLSKTKWQKLCEIVNSEKFNLKLSSDEIRSIFTLSDEENNPFFSVKTQNQDNFINLVGSYVKSQKYWKESLAGKFSEEKLRQEDFCQQKLDLQRKGYLLLEDLVRFLNIETGTFYRNRDLFLIFKRISTVNRIKLPELLGVFCHQN